MNLDDWRHRKEDLKEELQLTVTECEVMHGVTYSRIRASASRPSGISSGNIRVFGQSTILR